MPYAGASRKLESGLFLFSDSFFMCCLLIFTRNRKKRPEQLVACQFIARLPQTPRVPRPKLFLFFFFWPSAQLTMHYIVVRAIVTLHHVTSTLWPPKSSLSRRQNQLIWLLEMDAFVELCSNGETCWPWTEDQLFRPR